MEDRNHVFFEHGNEISGFIKHVIFGLPEKLLSLKKAEKNSVASDTCKR